MDIKKIFNCNILHVVLLFLSVSFFCLLIPPQTNAQSCSTKVLEWWVAYDVSSSCSSTGNSCGNNGTLYSSTSCTYDPNSCAPNCCPNPNQTPAPNGGLCVYYHCFAYQGCLEPTNTPIPTNTSTPPPPTNTPVPPSNTPVPTNTPIPPPPTNTPVPTNTPIPPTDTPIPTPTTAACACAAGYHCDGCGMSGGCYLCVPNYVACQGMNCGNDPVDGTVCGPACASGQTCVLNVCQVLATDTPSGPTDTPIVGGGATNTPPSCSWSGCGTSYCGIVTDGCGVQHNCTGNTCTAPDVCSGAYCVTPTPTQTPWTKLKNSSFQSLNNLTVTVPVNPVAFDSSDSGSAYFIDGKGLVSNTASSLSNRQTSSAGWQAAGYNPVISFTKGKILSYINSKKNHIELATLSANWQEITKTGIYYLPGDYTITAAPTFNFPFVLISDGTITVSPGTTFSPTSSVALIAPTITINGSVTSINAILIGNTIDTGTSTNKLKINGNMIAQTSFANNRSDAVTSNRTPSVFINFDPSLYIDLLPFLSIDKYEWKQLQ